MVLTCVEEADGEDEDDWDDEEEDRYSPQREREFFLDNLLVRIHLIIVMMRWPGLTPWEFEFPFPGSLTSTFLSRGRGSIQPSI